MDSAHKTPLAADESHLDLYTIPSHSSWFSWADIHETEKRHLPEFFDGGSITRTPKIYKEYRDFIISKYRECPTRRLAFTDVRKSLVGDVTVLHKVFRFLDGCGLINFGAGTAEREGEGEGEGKVRVEEGPPVGVRVAVVPNGGKMTLPMSGGGEGGGRVVENGSLLPPLASYRDVYGDREEVVCRYCKERCDSGHYQCVKEGCVKICIKCFKNSNHGKDYSVDDFELIGGTSDIENYTSVWTEAETLLLLESVLKHGDDWDLVAENVKTKSKADCISKLIQLPFGDLMLGSTYGRGKLWDKDSSMSSEKLASLESHVPESVKVGDQCPYVENKSEYDGNAEDESKQNGNAEDECKQNGNADDESKQNGNAVDESKQNGNAEGDSKQNGSAADESKQIGNAEDENKQNGDVGNQVTPLKRKRTNSSLDTDSSLMKQVALISSVVDPRITASAGEAAISALCEEIQCPREVLDGNDTEDEELEFFHNESTVLQVDGMDIDGKHTTSESKETVSPKDAIPLSLQMRAATATAFGAAAARAKLLADQEDREIENLVANIIEIQMKKIQHKTKHFDDLELIMETEYTELEDLKESIILERMNVLQRVFKAGVSRSWDQNHAKSQTGGVI